jgi:hypothetical protein
MGLITLHRLPEIRSEIKPACLWVSPLMPIPERILDFRLALRIVQHGPTHDLDQRIP